MKRTSILIIVASILAFSLLTSCGASSRSLNNQNTSVSNAQINEKTLNSYDKSENSTTNESGILNNTTGYDTEKKETSNNSTVAKTTKLITEVGIYIGQIDKNSIELSVDRQNGTYSVPDDLINYIETELSKGATVNFTYYENDENQDYITNIEKKYYSYIDGNGTYVGQIDDNSIEIIDSNTGKYITYILAQQTKAIISKIPENQNVQFIYYRNKANKLVISDIYGYTKGNTIVNSVGFFNGMIDANSIEIKDYNTGKTEAYRLTENIKTTMEKITDHTKVDFTYYINENNQKVINDIKEI
ncbi:hypothetical protein [Clostridium sp. DL1XJH146]